MEWSNGNQSLTTKAASAITLEPGGTYSLEYITKHKGAPTASTTLLCFSNANCTTSTGSIIVFSDTYASRDEEE